MAHKGGILFVDDHKLFRQALCSLIRQIFEEELLILEAGNGYDAIEILKNNNVELVITDIQMPYPDGLELMRQMQKMNHNAKVVVLTQFNEPSLILLSYQLGANGFLLKTCDIEELKFAIEHILEKGYYHNDLSIKSISEKISNQNRVRLDISLREQQILNLIKDGKTTKDISSILHLKPFTIESYRKALMKKMNCKSILEVLSLAYKTGLVSTTSNKTISTDIKRVVD